MRVLQGILLSLFLHFFLMWSAQFAPLMVSKLTSEAITVEILDENSSQNKTQQQIVRDVPVPDQLKTEHSEDPLAFLSNTDQRVKKQTQAALNGMTKNRSQQASTQTQQQDEIEDQRQQQVDPRTPGTLEAFTPKYKKFPTKPQRESAERSERSDLDRGLSTIGEALPQDVTVGSFTALNTDRFTYYSFFSRIEEAIRFPWETYVRNAIDTTPPDQFTYNGSGTWVTKMEILLTRNGEIQKIRLLKESGFRRFDQAATQAFRQARMFPNPPQEMVESDGYIHLKYSFQVRYEPKVVVKSSD